jgi:hypothetical protein
MRGFLRFPLSSSGQTEQDHEQLNFEQSLSQRISDPENFPTQNISLIFRDILFLCFKNKYALNIY